MRVIKLVPTKIKAAEYTFAFKSDDELIAFEKMSLRQYRKIKSKMGNGFVVMDGKAFEVFDGGNEIHLGRLRFEVSGV